MSIQPISFGATTKRGNHYKKSHIGTITGALAGAAVAAAEVKAMKNIKFPTKVLRRCVNSLKQLEQAGFGKEAAKKIVQSSVKTGIISGIASLSLVCLAIGAGVNKIINAAKARKADRNA